MPIYDYTCAECGSSKELFNSIANRHEAPQCPSCGSDMKLAIRPTHVAPIMGTASFPGYECPVTGEFVTSRKRRREIMQEHNLVEKE